MSLITELRAEQSRLEAELAEVEPKRKRLALVIDLLKSFGEEPGETPLIPRSPDESASRFAPTGMTDGIMKFLSSHPGSFYIAREIATALLAGGFKSDSKNLNVMIKTTCLRKCSGPDAPLVRGEKGGVVAFAFQKGATV